MKKYIYLIIFILGFANASYAGGKVGVSLSAGVFEASAKETESDETSISKTGEVLFVLPSFFVEFSPNDRFFLGLDYVPVSGESETTEHKVNERAVGGDGVNSNDNSDSTVTQNVQVDFEDLTTLYARFALNENFYVKAGMMQVEAKTNEKLGTGSQYPNKTLDGTMLGVGYENDLGGNGAFIRAEANWMEFGGETFNSTNNSDNKVTVSDIDGYGARISIGRSF